MSEQARQMLAKLLKERILYVADPLSDEAALLVAAQLKALEADPSPATLYLTGKGGPTSAVMAIYEAMRGTSFALRTVAMGRVEGWAALLVSAGEPGARCAAPAAHFVVGPPEVDGAGMDFQAYLQRVRSVCETFNKMLAHHTGQSLETIAAIKQPRHLSGQEAIAFGLIDAILD
ncbi:MAG: ATP-dependent Clp protease proteolytic subunit [Candidatus Eremiobacteraeota bacterium]|nr:ATP-dependent Clp protease proteolytic subunit [Candidatus Eremiobacteraeota bacterium]MCW5870693.1 ATP-dependent Clp protease proteolytic subunit [Candidatus Eremiobacteraeota bacterium]